jgi:hypothetical protein
MGLRLVASRPPNENGAFSPEQLLTLFKAFDEVWDAVKPHHVSDPQSVEAARMKLADCLLAKYRAGVTNPEMLKAAALQSMQYRA